MSYVLDVVTVSAVLYVHDVHDVHDVILKMYGACTLLLLFMITGIVNVSYLAFLMMDKI